MACEMTDSADATRRGVDGFGFLCAAIRAAGVGACPGDGGTRTAKSRVRRRGVLVVEPAGEDRPQAFFATDNGLAPERIVELFVLRWNVEVTFEETRRHLGVETQRRWSGIAIARTTPAFMGLFSLVCLMALRLVGKGAMPVRQAAWHKIKDATFSDVLAFARRAVWASKYFVNSKTGGDRLELSCRDLDALLDQLAAVVA